MTYAELEPKGIRYDLYLGGFDMIVFEILAGRLRDIAVTIIETVEPMIDVTTS